jgi:hypothetical protein
MGYPNTDEYSTPAYKRTGLTRDPIGPSSVLLHDTFFVYISIRLSILRGSPVLQFEGPIDTASVLTI